MEGKKSIVFLETEPWEQEFLESRLKTKADVRFFPERLTENNYQLAKDADYLATFIYSDLSGQVLSQLPKLKGISTMSVGCDHIDCEFTAQHHITVCNVPNYGPTTVAEHTIALLLALSRDIVPAVERTRGGQFDFTGLLGWDLRGKTLGVVGTGKIGAIVTQIAHGLGMKLVGYDPHPNPELTNSYGLKYISLPKLLENVDVITLHLALTQETHYLIDEKEFGLMKKGVVLINTARGGLVNTSALLNALNEGIVRQAGLDVLEEEVLLKEEKQFYSRYFNLKDYQTALADHALMKDPRVLVTPHNAFNSQESLGNILQTTVDNLAGLINNSPINVVK